MYHCRFDPITEKDYQYVAPRLRRNADGTAAVDSAGVELPLHDASDEVLARLAAETRPDQS